MKEDDNSLFWLKGISSHRRIERDELIIEKISQKISKSQIIPEWTIERVRNGS